MFIRRRRTSSRSSRIGSLTSMTATVASSCPTTPGTGVPLYPRTPRAIDCASAGCSARLIPNHPYTIAAARPGNAILASPHTSRPASAEFHPPSSNSRTKLSCCHGRGTVVPNGSPSRVLQSAINFSNRTLRPPMVSSDHSSAAMPDRLARLASKILALVIVSASQLLHSFRFFQSRQPIKRHTQRGRQNEQPNKTDGMPC